jgi:hypothetical protein
MGAVRYQWQANGSNITGATGPNLLLTQAEVGKTIGVISHVPAMQERIAAQINVTKESGGCSRVRIVA